MNQKQLLETLKFSSPRVIYIVTWDKKLKVLRCPFYVKVIKPINDLQMLQIVTVDKVWNTNKLETVFEVKGELYLYSHFDIIV